jgi:hypothetical protein
MSSLAEELESCEAAAGTGATTAPRNSTAARRQSVSPEVAETLSEVSEPPRGLGARRRGWAIATAPLLPWIPHPHGQRILVC